jgi:hypothetical protein
MKNWTERSSIGDMFIKIATSFKSYTAYVSKYDQSVNKMVELRDKHPKLFEFLEIRRGDKLLTDGKPFSSFLILPIQRIPRYILLLQNVAKLNDKFEENIESAMNQIETIAEFLNEKVMKNKTL